MQRKGSVEDVCMPKFRSFDFRVCMLPRKTYIPLDDGGPHTARSHRIVLISRFLAKIAQIEFTLFSRFLADQAHIELTFLK